MKSRIGTLGALLLACTLIGCASTPISSHNQDLQLIRAAEKGEIAEVCRLIKSGADVNARDEEGWTPYLAASSMGHFEAMRILKAFGAKTIAPDREPNVSHRFLADR